MIAAIYSRKSKYTGIGESVENQIQLCKEYGIKHLEIDEKDFIIYEDEGFSGSNTKRPQFQMMMKDAKNKAFDIIICYRLDRISRNVLDFSKLVDTLNKYNIGFVSVREQFDTTTPMGRAMMYIASVFSQLERETIAERIKDNMLQLAKTGRWLGGVPPTGYVSEPLINKEPGGKEKREYKLKIIEDEIEIVKVIYDKFLELESLAAVEKYMMEKNIKTKNNADFNRFSIKLILQNPVYAIADKTLFKYLKNEGYCLSTEEERFDGIYGIIAYNKTMQKRESSSPKYKSVDQWIIAVGKHKGIIPGDLWIKVQKLLKQNSGKSCRKAKSSMALLSGILRCASCGSFMRPKAIQRINSEGEQIFYYICETKEKSKKSRCLISNINGNALDRQIRDEINKFIVNDSSLNDDIYDKASKKVIYEIENIRELAEKIGRQNTASWDSMDIHEKRIIIKSMVDKILWDGEKLGIILANSYMFPQCEDSK